MTGWCPVHDRVYETPDGFCPRCGTALVEDADAPRPVQPVSVMTPDDGVPVEDEIAEAPSRKQAGILVAAGAVLIAFVAGLAFPQAGKREAERPAASPARVDLNVGIGRQGAGVTLRLESFVQEGRRVVLRITVPSDQNLDLGRIRSADIEFATLGDRRLVTMPVRTTVSGFVVEGLALPHAEAPVTGVRILALNLALGDLSDAVNLDLSGVIPAPGQNRPVARAARGRTEAGGRTFSLTGLVGWPERLEVAMTIAGSPESWSYDDEFRLDLGDRGEIMGNLFQSIEGRAIVFFENVPPDVERAALHVQVDNVVIHGEWRWVLPRAS